MRSIKQIKNLKGKTVLVRVDFNVPIKKGKIGDDFRIKKSFPTIRLLKRKGAKKIILITHLGEKGSEKLAPIINRFFKISPYSKSKVEFFDNIRKFSGETKNNSAFAKKLAKLADPTLNGRAGIYVNEAFSVSHRKHASIVGLPKFLPSYAGIQLQEEAKNLSHAFKKIKRPFLFILGGAKFSTKMPLIKRYLKLADHIFIGGALANDFLKAEGYEIGQSLTDNANYDIGKFLKNKKLILPIDVVVNSKNKLINKKVSEIKKNETILDIGAESIKMIGPYIRKSRLILFNGPLGQYKKGGGKATEKVLKLTAHSHAESIIGGGDTVALVSAMKMEKRFTFVSTGGGATLDFLANGTLPGIKALE